MRYRCIHKIVNVYRILKDVQWSEMRCWLYYGYCSRLLVHTVDRIAYFSIVATVMKEYLLCEKDWRTSCYN